MSAAASRVTAIALAVFSALVVAALAARAVQLQRAENVETEQLAQEHSRAAAFARDRLSLPPARPLAVCNDSSLPITISVLAAVYPGPRGTFVTYNSASDNWRSWTIPPGSVERFPDSGAAAGAWDHSAIFFSLDVKVGDMQRLFAGTSGDLADGCFHITTAKMRQGD
jgi:hypothetical protein